MGGGKGNIDHYVTPIRSGRIIIEIAGHCEYVEVCLIIELTNYIKCWEKLYVFDLSSLNIN